MMQELSYIRCGDYYIPDIRLPKETRPIGRWGRMHRDYIKEHNPIRFNRFSLPEQQLPLRLQNSQHTVCCGCQAELRAPWCGLHDEVQDSGSDC